MMMSSGSISTLESIFCAFAEDRFVKVLIQLCMVRIIVKELDEFREFRKLNVKTHLKFIKFKDQIISKAY